MRLKLNDNGWSFCAQFYICNNKDVLFNTLVQVSTVTVKYHRPSFSSLYESSIPRNPLHHTDLFLEERADITHRLTCLVLRWLRFVRFVEHIWKVNREYTNEEDDIHHNLKDILACFPVADSWNLSITENLSDAKNLKLNPSVLCFSGPIIL